jgi:hypothetical protein
MQGQLQIVSTDVTDNSTEASTPVELFRPDITKLFSRNATIYAFISCSITTAVSNMAAMRDGSPLRDRQNCRVQMEPLLFRVTGAIWNCNHLLEN